MQEGGRIMRLQSYVYARLTRGDHIAHTFHSSASFRPSTAGPEFIDASAAAKEDVHVDNTVFFVPATVPRSIAIRFATADIYPLRRGHRLRRRQPQQSGSLCSDSAPCRDTAG